MSGDKKILIVGGDKRQDHLFEILTNKGCKCVRVNTDIQKAMEELYSARVIVLPVPVVKNGEYIYSENKDFKLKAKDFLSEISSEQLVLGGAFNRDAIDIFHENQVIFRDMFKFEYFVKYNAFLTAQGALKLMLNNTEKLITGCKVLVTGFGRVGKALAQSLKNINADVFVSARNPEQLTEAACLGYKTLNIKNVSQVIYLFDYIFNTVPEIIFTDSDISHIRNDCIYFELASKPYGAKSECFERNEKQIVMGDALPGKHVAYSAAEKICEFVEMMI